MYVRAWSDHPSLAPSTNTPHLLTHTSLLLTIPHPSTHTPHLLTISQILKSPHSFLFPSSQSTIPPSFSLIHSSPSFLPLSPQPLTTSPGKLLPEVARWSSASRESSFGSNTSPGAGRYASSPLQVDTTHVIHVHTCVMISLFTEMLKMHIHFMWQS